MFGNVIYTSPESYCRHALLSHCKALQVNTKIQYTPSGIGYIIIESTSPLCSQSPAVFCYHQNASIWNTLPAAVRYSNAHGRRVVLFDYPGYGLSEGSPREGNIVAALDDVIRMLDLQSVHLVGDSIGAGVVLSYMANQVKPHSQTRTQVETIRLISPFISMKARLCGDSFVLSFAYQMCGDCFYQNDRNIFAVPETVPIFIFELTSYSYANYIPVERSRDGLVLSQLRGNTHYMACDYPDCDTDTFGYLCATKEDVAFPYAQHTEKMSEF